MQIILIPILFSGLTIGYLLFWFIELAYLWSIGTVTQGSATPFITVVWDKKNYLYVITHFFAALWNIAFLKYMSLLIIACACVIWYYNNKDGKGFFHFPVLMSVWWSIRYHLGSIAFGSFILALIWAVQLILSYITARVKSLSGQGNTNKAILALLYCF